jgi:hypothetical protein
LLLHHCARAREGVSATHAAVAAISSTDVRDSITDDFPNARFPREDSLDTTYTNCRHYRPPCHPGTGHFSGGARKLCRAL